MNDQTKPQLFAVFQLFDGKPIHHVDVFPNKHRADDHYDMLMTYPESRVPLCDDVRIAVFSGEWVLR